MSADPTALEVATLASRLLAGNVCGNDEEAVTRALDLIVESDRLLHERIFRDLDDTAMLRYISPEEHGNDEDDDGLDADDFPMEFERALKLIIPGTAAERRQRLKEWLTSRRNEGAALKRMEDLREKGFNYAQWRKLVDEFPVWWARDVSATRSKVGKKGRAAPRKKARKKARKKRATKSAE